MQLGVWVCVLPPLIHGLIPNPCHPTTLLLCDALQPLFDMEAARAEVGASRFSKCTPTPSRHKLSPMVTNQAAPATSRAASAADNIGDHAASVADRAPPTTDTAAPSSNVSQGLGHLGVKAEPTSTLEPSSLHGRGPGRPRTSSLPSPERSAGAAPPKRGPGRPRTSSLASPERSVGVAPPRKGPGRPRTSSLASPGRSADAAPARRGPGRPRTKSLAPPKRSRDSAPAQSGPVLTTQPVADPRRPVQEAGVQPSWQRRDWDHQGEGRVTVCGLLTAIPLATTQPLSAVPRQPTLSAPPPVPPQLQGPAAGPAASQRQHHVSVAVEDVAAAMRAALGSQVLSVGRAAGAHVQAHPLSTAPAAATRAPAAPYTQHNAPRHIQARLVLGDDGMSADMRALEDVLSGSTPQSVGPEPPSSLPLLPARS